MKLADSVRAETMITTCRSQFQWILVFSLLIESATCNAQNSHLPAITLRDTVLAKVLREYTTTEKVSITAVFIERYDGDYTYTLYSFGLFDQLKRNPTPNYGAWNGSTLLFYTGLEDIISTQDSIKVNRLLRHFRPKLPDQITIRPTGVPNETLTEAFTYDPVIWRFKVRNGKLLWLRRQLDYQAERVPYLK